jgi:hypothetical protein
VARHLEGVESLDGLPPDLLEALLGCARRRKVLSDESLPRLIGAGLSTLDLSGQNMLSDVALRSRAACPAVCASVQHVSLCGCRQVTLSGVQALLHSCAQLEHLDITHCNIVRGSPARPPIHPSIHRAALRVCWARFADSSS